MGTRSARAFDLHPLCDDFSGESRESTINSRGFADAQVGKVRGRAIDRDCAFGRDIADKLDRLPVLWMHKLKFAASSGNIERDDLTAHFAFDRRSELESITKPDHAECEHDE